MNLEKEFVPYTEVLELKELGVDEPCFAFWDAYNGGTHLLFKPRTSYHWMVRLYNALKGIDSKTVLDYTTGLLEHEEGDNAVLAPTYSQAFRWFREKYTDLDFGVGKIHNGTNNYHYHINLKWEFFEGTYEEAELACLRKLIEIEKNK